MSTRAEGMQQPSERLAWPGHGRYRLRLYMTLLCPTLPRCAAVRNEAIVNAFLADLPSQDGWPSPGHPITSPSGSLPLISLLASDPMIFHLHRASTSDFDPAFPLCCLLSATRRMLFVVPGVRLLPPCCGVRLPALLGHGPRTFRCLLLLLYTESLPSRLLALWERWPN